MTLKDTITRELLDSVDNPVGLEEVCQQYGRSKGPFYSALAQATTELRHRFRQAHEAASQTELERDELRQEVNVLKNQRQDLESTVGSLNQQLQERSGKLDDVQGLVGRVQALAQRGFGEEELTRLYRLLVGVAEAKGALPEEGVAWFFQWVEGYGQIASLELETTRAESRVAQGRDEADKWEAQARQKESQSRARSGAIDLTEALLVQGVMADGLLQWLQLLATVGVTASELTENLEQYGSLEKLAQARQDQVGELEGQRPRRREFRFLAFAESDLLTHSSL